MNQILMTTLVECLAFLELSGDENINSDAAVAEMEVISDQLGDLQPEDRAVFVKHIQHMAAEARKNGADIKRVDFLDQLPESLGLY